MDASRQLVQIAISTYFPLKSLLLDHCIEQRTKSPCLDFKFGLSWLTDLIISHTNWKNESPWARLYMTSMRQRLSRLAKSMHIDMINNSFVCTAYSTRRWSLEILHAECIIILLHSSCKVDCAYQWAEWVEATATFSCIEILAMASVTKHLTSQHERAKNAPNDSREGSPDLSQLKRWLESVEDQCRDMFTIREEYAQAHLEFLYKQYSTSAAIVPNFMQKHSWALMHRTIVRMLQKIDLGDCFTEAEKKAYLEVVQVLLSKLKTVMTREEANDMYKSVKGRVHPLMICCSIASQAVSALFDELFNTSAAVNEKMQKIHSSNLDQMLVKFQQSAPELVAICHGKSTEEKPETARIRELDKERVLQYAKLEYQTRHTERSVTQDRRASERLLSTLQCHLQFKGRKLLLCHKTIDKRYLEILETAIRPLEVFDKPSDVPESSKYVTMQQRKMARAARQVSLLGVQCTYCIVVC